MVSETSSKAYGRGYSYLNDYFLSEAQTARKDAVVYGSVWQEVTAVQHPRTIHDEASQSCTVRVLG